MGTTLENLGITPGPWELIEVGDKCRHLCPAKDNQSILTVALEYNDLKSDEPTYFGVVYNPADARLIGAAPEMFLAIVAMLKCAKSNDMAKGAEVLSLMEEVVQKVSGDVGA
jgi:hypothetical protein